MIGWELSCFISIFFCELHIIGSESAKTFCYLLITSNASYMIKLKVQFCNEGILGCDSNSFVSFDLFNLFGY